MWTKQCDVITYSPIFISSDSVNCFGFSYNRFGLKLKITSFKETTLLFFILNFLPARVLGSTPGGICTSHSSSSSSAVCFLAGANCGGGVYLHCKEYIMYLISNCITFIIQSLHSLEIIIMQFLQTQTVFIQFLYYYEFGISIQPRESFYD